MEEYSNVSNQTNSLDEQKGNDKIDDDERLTGETLDDYQGGNDVKLKLDDNQRDKLRYYLDQKGKEKSTDNRGGNEESNYNPGGNEKSNDNPGGNEKSNDNPGGKEKSNDNPGGMERSNNNPGGKEKSNDKPGVNEKSSHNPGGKEKSNDKPGVNEKSSHNPGGDEKSDDNPGENEKKFNDNQGLNMKKSNNKKGGGEKIYHGNPGGNKKGNDNPGGNEHSNGNPEENKMSNDNQEGNEESKDNLGRNDKQENEEKSNDNQEGNKKKSDKDRKESEKKSNSDQERNGNCEDNQLGNENKSYDVQEGNEDKSNDDDHGGNEENCNDKQKRNEKKSDDDRLRNEKKFNDNEGRSKKLGNDQDHKEKSKDDRGGSKKMSNDRDNTILKKPLSEKIPKKSENARSSTPLNIISKKVKSRKPENNKPNIPESKKATTEEKIPLVIPVNIEDGNTAVASKSFEEMFKEAVADIAAYKKRSESRVLGGFASNPNNLLEEAKFLKFLVDAFRSEFNDYEMILEGAIEAMKYSGEFIRCLQAATTYGISKDAMKTITGLVKQIKKCFGGIDEAIFDCLRQPVIDLDEYFAKKENVIPIKNIKKQKFSSWVIDCYSQKKPLHSRAFTYENLLFEFSLQELRIYENHLLPNLSSYSERCTFTGVFFVLKFIDGRESELFIDTADNSLYCWQLGMLCSGESSGSFEGGRGCVDSKNIIIKTYIDGGRERVDDFMYGIPDIDEVVKNIPVGSVISERQFGKEIELTVNRTPKKDKICHLLGTVSKLTNLSKFPSGNFVITNCGVMVKDPVTP